MPLKDPGHGALRGGKTPVLIDSGKHRLQRIAENGVPAAAALQLLAPAQAKARVQPQFPRAFGQPYRAHEP